MDRWDAITIGGGPAGSAFAISLARAGRRVLVLEKAKSAHHKVCGEFLSADCLSLLHHCGVDVEKYGATPQRYVRLIANRKHSVAPLPFRAAGLSRFRLDRVLLEKAAEAGAEVHYGTRATAIERDEDGYHVATGLDHHVAPLVGFATGKHNLRGPAFPNIARPGNSLVGFKMLASPDAATRQCLDGHVQLMSYRNGYQGMQFIEDDQISIAWIVDAATAKQLGTDWNSHCAFLARQSALVGDTLSDVRPDWDKPMAVSVPPLSYLRPSIIHPGIYPLGDQMAVIPPFTGDGLAIALATGLAAAQACLQNIDAETYQARIRTALTLQFRLARLSHAAILNPVLRWTGIRALAAFPGMATWIARTTRLPPGITGPLTMERANTPQTRTL